MLNNYNKQPYEIICEVTKSKLETLKKKNPMYYRAYFYVSNHIRLSSMLHCRYQINYGDKYSHKNRILDGDRYIFDRIDNNIGGECLQPGICIVYKNDNITGSIISRDLDQIYDKIEKDGIYDIENSYEFYITNSYCGCDGYDIEASYRDLIEVKQMIKQYLLAKNML
jgi:hypothetical protein